MHLFRLLAAGLGCVVLLSAPVAARAAQSYDNCTGFIDSLPAVIGTQGTWCLRHDVSSALTNGQMIIINANNVTIDCNDFKVGGLAAGLGTQAIGVYALDRSNTTIRHCNFRGFQYGIWLQNMDVGGGHAIEDNRFDVNTYTGMRIEGDGSVIRRNRLFDTGGSTVINHGYAIVAVGSVDVLDNTVSGVAATTGTDGVAVGITTQGNPDGLIAGNSVRGLVKQGTGFMRGILNISSGRITLRDNDLAGDGLSGSIGLMCSGATGHSKDNVIKGFDVSIQACSDDGNVVGL